MGYAKVQVRVGDGYHGWEEHAPYGGRMVIPVGASFMVQYLMLVEKNLDGTVSTRQILPVKFVPLTGQR